MVNYSSAALLQVTKAVPVTATKCAPVSGDCEPAGGREWGAGAAPHEDSCPRQPLHTPANAGHVAGGGGGEPGKAHEAGCRCQLWR